MTLIETISLTANVCTIFSLIYMFVQQRKLIQKVSYLELKITNIQNSYTKIESKIRQIDYILSIDKSKKNLNMNISNATIMNSHVI